MSSNPEADEVHAEYNLIAEDRRQGERNESVEEMNRAAQADIPDAGAVNDTFREHGTTVPADKQLAELRRRRAALDADSDPGEPWESVLNSIESRSE